MNSLELELELDLELVAFVWRAKVLVMFLWKINASIEPRWGFPTLNSESAPLLQAYDIWPVMTNAIGLASFCLERKLELEITG